MDREKFAAASQSSRASGITRLLVILAVFGLIGYLVFGTGRFTVKPATGTAQAMAAAGAK